MKAQKAASWSNSQLRVALLPMLGKRWSTITWWRGWWTDDYGNDGKDCEDFDDVGGGDCDDGDDENATAYYTNSGGDVTVPQTTKYLAYTSRLDTITIAKETCKSDFFSDKSHSPWKMFNCKRSQKGVKLRFFLNLSPSKVGLKWSPGGRGMPTPQPPTCLKIFYSATPRRR